MMNCGRAYGGMRRAMTSCRLSRPMVESTLPAVRLSISKWSTYAKPWLMSTSTIVATRMCRSEDLSASDLRSMTPSTFVDDPSFRLSQRLSCSAMQADPLRFCFTRETGPPLPRPRD